MDVYESISPALKEARVFGLAPFKIITKRTSKELILSTKSVLYSCVLYVLIFGMLILVLIHFTSTFLSSELVYVFHTWQVCGDALLSIFCGITNILNSRQFRTILVELNKIDSRLKANGVKLEYHHRMMRKYSNILTIYSIFLFSCLYIVELYGSILGEFSGLYTAYVHLFVFHIPKAINYSFVALYFRLMLLLHNRFKILNNHLNKQRNDKEHNFEDIKNIFFLNFNGVRCRQITCLHGKLYNVAVRLNAMFSTLLLFIIVSTFVNILSELSLEFFHLEYTQKDALHEVAIVAIFVLIGGSQLVGIAISCSITSEEANDTARCVHKLIQSTDDPRLISELRRFSIQLLDRKLTFTACGFFPLDLTLLHSIIGGVTTYLVIMIQFQTMSRDRKAPDIETPA